MKRISKLFLIVILVLGVVFVTGCSKDTKSNDSISERLVNKFSDSVSSKDINKMAKEISSSISEIAVDTDVLNEDSYIAGFDKTIPEYKSGIAIRPMIGSIPFIAYVFEVDNGEEFAKELENISNKRWNVCTEADDMMTKVIDNYVFFVMAPKSFEE